MANTIAQRINARIKEDIERRKAGLPDLIWKPRKKKELIHDMLENNKPTKRKV